MRRRFLSEKNAPSSRYVEDGSTLLVTKDDVCRATSLGPHFQPIYALNGPHFLQSLTSNEHSVIVAGLVLICVLSYVCERHWTLRNYRQANSGTKSGAARRHSVYTFLQAFLAGVLPLFVEIVIELGFGGAVFGVTRL